MATDVTLSETPQDDLMRRWFRPLLERGTTTCAPNLETTPAFLRGGEIELPLTVNEALAQQHHLRRPIAIQVRPTGQYTEITAVRFM